MKPLLLLALFAAATPAQAEDAAHRADRLEVRRLNTRSPNGYAGGGPRDAESPADGQRAYAKAQADYRDRLDAWRRRVAACEAGWYDACR